MLIQKEFEHLNYFKSFYENDDPGHDWSHILRVVKLCQYLAKDTTANKKLLIPAAVLHDIVNIPKNSANRSSASKLASEKAKKLLLESDYQYSDKEVDLIAQIVLEHSYSANLSPTSIESEILQDADKLDSMGAIGIMRWTSVGTKMNAFFYDTEDPFAENRELNDKKFSLDHFEKKLSKLFDRLNTKRSKEIGRERFDFMLSFIKQLKKEI